jgi:hypothetical protein
MNIQTFPDRYSGVINVESSDQHATPINPTGRFSMPLIDVRDGEAARDQANRILKAVNRQTGSKYFK